MGIPGVYRQLGSGERIALSKLAVEYLENVGRPLRIAIDIAIWDFQTQLGEGGSNPVLRTFYFRLLRLLGHGIRPLFIFDGPKKPAIKRNKQRGYHGHSLADSQSKELLNLVGFPYHIAPGEAEAECALLQRHGIVDAVLSEDVDTLMFGCTRLIRNWSSEVSRGNKQPTHVDYYKAEQVLSSSGLSSNGLILVALMSGGDYDTEGIPGCGPNIAAQAAKAGFAKALLKLAPDDEAGLKTWRDWLQHELHSNEGGYFGRRHTNVTVPDNFPRRDLLELYMNPVVSSKEQLEQLADSLDWSKSISVPHLRKYVADAFQWSGLSGAKKFIRTLSSNLLIHRLLEGSLADTSQSDEREYERGQEPRLIRSICDRRRHVVTDGLEELRIAFIPADIVNLDLEEEEEANDVANGDHASHLEFFDVEDPNIQAPLSPSKSRRISPYDPLATEKIWVLETFVKLGMPLLWETWMEAMRDPAQFATRKSRAKKPAGKGGMKAGALDAYVKVTKPGALRQPPSVVPGALANVRDRTSDAKPIKGRDNLEDRAIFNELSQSYQDLQSDNEIGDIDSHQIGYNPRIPTSTRKTAPETAKVVMEWQDRKRKAIGKPAASSSKLAVGGSGRADLGVPRKGEASEPETEMRNPWTLSRRPSNTFGIELPRGTRYSALGVYSSGTKDDSSALLPVPANNRDAPILLDSPTNTPEKLAQPQSNSSIDNNVTVRRKRKAKPMTRAYTAPNELCDAVDLESSEPEPALGLTACKPGSDRRGPRNKDVPPPLETTCDPHESSRPSTPDPKPRAEPALIEVSPSSDSSLPSASALICHSRQPPSIHQTVDTTFARDASPTTQRRQTGKLIMLRESLEGSWRDAEPSERTRRPARVFSSVGVVDLTSTP